MREILFRGKSTNNGEWVYGVPVIAKDDITDKDITVMVNNPNEIVPMEGLPLFEQVDPETVGQFTGLTDKNGRRIFEGDICRMKADRLKGYGAIIFMGSAFVLCDKTHKKTRYYPLYPDGQFTVVGNIHDNPELLEGKS